MASLTACVGDDTAVAVPDAGTAGPLPDGSLDSTVASDDGGGASDDGSPDATETGATIEAGGDAADAAVNPGFMLLSYTFDEYQKSELDAVDLATGETKGRFSYAQGGTNVVTGASPWVLEQFGDIVAKMSPTQPWIPASTWNVASPVPDAGGYAYGNAMSVAETGSKAYVALFNRNAVPVLDTTASVDAGAPTSSVDLSSLLQAGDEDGMIEDVAAIYDDSTTHVWLVLGNIDEYTVVGPTYDLICVPGLTSTVVAIDPASDQLIGGLTYTLSGIDPGAVAFDAANERLLIMSAGCNEPPDAGSDAGPGALHGRMIEALDLKTGVSTVLYDANNQPFPSQLVYVDAHHAFVSFSGSAYAWDPTLTALGVSIPNAPDSFAWDGHGLVGPKTSYLNDGGVSIDVIEVAPFTGVVTTIGPSPVSTEDPSGYFEGLALWKP